MEKSNFYLNFSELQNRIWVQLRQSVPDHDIYVSNLEKYDTFCDFSQKLDCKNLAIPIHSFLFDNCMYHPLIEELEEIVENNSFELHPFGCDLNDFVRKAGIIFGDEQTNDWAYAGNEEDNFSLSNAFAYFRFEYKNYSFAIVSLHPGGTFDARGPYTEGKIYMLTYGQLFRNYEIKAQIIGTKKTLQHFEIETNCYFNDKLNLWCLKTTNEPVLLIVE